MVSMSGVSKKEPKSDFTKRLKALMAGEKNHPFEDRCGLTSNSLNRYLDGQLPKLDVLQKIVEATGCNGHWLLTGEGEPFFEKGEKC